MYGVEYVLDPLIKVLCFSSTMALFSACAPVHQWPVALPPPVTAPESLQNQNELQEMAHIEPLVDVSEGPASELFEDFFQEIEQVNQAINCPDPKISPRVDHTIGQLYGCYMGQDKGVRVFVNETPEQAVKDIKLSWTQAHQAATDIDPNQAIAQEMLTKLVDLYDAELVTVLKTKFFADESMAIQNDTLLFRYTFTPGYAANERLLTITKRENLL